ncbi:MAG: DUF692 domain-containing protein [Hydrogenophilus thermoluteolus]
MIRTSPSQPPARAGIGLKPEHFRAIQESWPDIGFFEIHAENYFVAGGPFHRNLERIRERYALSIHGVGLSLGGEAPLDRTHLRRLKHLLDRYQPESFSEHLAWSSHQGYYLNDLLPLPYTNETLTRVCTHIDQTQEALGCRLLLENPATYLEFATSTWSESDFLQEVVRRTGCGLLLDVNNLYISAINHHRDPVAMLETLPLHAVGEIHVAGFHRDRDAAGSPLLIDTHGAAVDDAVWTLYQKALAHLGPVATLLERDQNLPLLVELVAEAQIAERYLLAAHPESAITAPLESV